MPPLNRGESMFALPQQTLPIYNKGTTITTTTSSFTTCQLNRSDSSSRKRGSNSGYSIDNNCAPPSPPQALHSTFSSSTYSTDQPEEERLWVIDGLYFTCRDGDRVSSTASHSSSQRSSLSNESPAGNDRQPASVSSFAPPSSKYSQNSFSTSAQLLSPPLSPITPTTTTNTTTPARSLIRIESQELLPHRRPELGIRRSSSPDSLSSLKRRNNAHRHPQELPQQQHQQQQQQQEKKVVQPTKALKSILKKTRPVVAARHQVHAYMGPMLLYQYQQLENQQRQHPHQHQQRVLRQQSLSSSHGRPPLQQRQSPPQLLHLIPNIKQPSPLNQQSTPRPHQSPRPLPIPPPIKHVRWATHTNRVFKIENIEDLIALGYYDDYDSEMGWDYRDESLDDGLEVVEDSDEDDLGSDFYSEEDEDEREEIEISVAEDDLIHRLVTDQFVRSRIWTPSFPPPTPSSTRFNPKALSISVPSSPPPPPPQCLPMAPPSSPLSPSSPPPSWSSPQQQRQHQSTGSVGGGVNVSGIIQRLQSLEEHKYSYPSSRGYSSATSMSSSPMISPPATPTFAPVPPRRSSSLIGYGGGTSVQQRHSWPPSQCSRGVDSSRRSGQSPPPMPSPLSPLFYLPPSPSTSPPPKWSSLPVLSSKVVPSVKNKGELPRLDRGQILDQVTDRKKNGVETFPAFVHGTDSAVASSPPPPSNGARYGGPLKRSLSLVTTGSASNRS
ncbi:MAG: hypothetical protein J3R72DRAFT_446623 [Linnemannia gamsii]|nr:MAG: hypothetical protein J3R72DRAFT_446623 [Linnemannia gamsii]